METSNDDYSQLKNHMQELRYLENAQSMLNWDAKTYMPENGIQQRSQQLAILGRMTHEMHTKPQVGEWLQKAKAAESDPLKTRNLELWQRGYDQATKYPSEFVERMTKQQMITEDTWQKAKRKSDFPMVFPELEKLVDLTKEQAHYLDPDKDPYDVLVDLYEINITAADITNYFTPLKEAVIKIVKKCDNACNDMSDAPSLENLKIPVTLEQQKALSKWLIEFTGLDPLRSRLDETEHPFTTGYADDVRITTHYLENDAVASMYSVLHEAGHALYESNLPKEHFWTPIGESVSLGIHESQSRFNENIIGKNPIFLTKFYPKIQEIIPGYKNIPLQTFINGVNAVTPTKIRIYADEVTYNLHVILRFEIERDLFAEKFTVKELPQVWNQKMKDFLGIDIEDDAEGVLQDVHWYAGLLGYFPTYALGNIYNGQMFNTLKKEIPDWDTQLAAGDYTNIRQWMITNVHQQGSLLNPKDLIKKITGEMPKADYFIDYMNKKFSKIYNISL